MSKAKYKSKKLSLETIKGNSVSTNPDVALTRSPKNTKLDPIDSNDLKGRKSPKITINQAKTPKPTLPSLNSKNLEKFNQETHTIDSA